MTTLTQKMQDLNEVDLSRLAERIAAVKAELTAALTAKGETSATDADIAAAARRAGVTAEEFIETLEYARRMGLI